MYAMKMPVSNSVNDTALLVTSVLKNSTVYYRVPVELENKI